MLAAMWSGARGWLTPPVLFVFVNLVVGAIAVMSKLMSAAAPGDGGERSRSRSLMRAPSAAFDRLRCFSFSRLGLPAAQYPPFDDGAAAEGERPMSFLHAPSAAFDRLRGFSFSRLGLPAADHAAQYPPFDDGAAEPAPGECERRMSFLRAPSVALDRFRGFSFSRRDVAADHGPVTQQPPSDGAADAEPSSRAAPAEAAIEREREPELAQIERSQSEAAAVLVPAARRRPRARRTRKPAREEPAHLSPANGPPVEGTGLGGATHHVGAGAGAGDGEEEAPAVDARADDFIRRFREQLRMQRLDSIIRYTDTLRRTGTA